MSVPKVLAFRANSHGLRKTSSVGFSVQIPLLSTSSDNSPFFAWNTCPLSMKAITRGGSGRGGGFVWGGGGVCLGGGWGGLFGGVGGFARTPQIKTPSQLVTAEKKKTLFKV